MWWGKRRKRGARLSRQLALGMLEDAMRRAEEQPGSSDPIPQQEIRQDTQQETGRPVLAEADPEQDQVRAADGSPAGRGQPAGDETPDLTGKLPAQRRPGRPAPRATGSDSSPSPSPSPRAEGSARDRLVC
jgi:hypothetical protein